MDTLNIESNDSDNLNNFSLKFWNLLETNKIKTQNILTQGNLLSNQKDKEIKPLNKKFPNLPLFFSKKAKAIDFLNLFFDEEIWNLIISQTNLYASQVVSEKKKNLKANSRYQEWKPVTYREIQVFHGLILWNGLLSNKDLNDNWSSNEIFQTNHGKYMSNNRFHLINSFLHLNNNEDNLNNDPLHKLRPLITMLNNSFEKFYEYDEKLCIDECMIKYNGLLSFKQYIPSKPTKHGIKGFLLCNSINYYCYKIEIYTGKNLFSQKDNLSSIEQCVIRLCRNVFDQYKVVYMDSYYTTIKLGLYFTHRKTGLIGTMRENRTRLLKEQIPKKKGDYYFFINLERNLTLTSIFDKKVVFVLSNVTVPKMIKVYLKKKEKKTQYFKPNVIVDYNFFSKGVDFCNRRTVNYRYPHKNMKWWKSVYYHLFHLCLNNAFVLYNEFYQSKIDYKNFYVEIIESLLKEKKKNKKEKQYHLVNYINKEKKSSKRLRCRLCSSLTCWKCKSCSFGNYICSLCVPNCFEKYHEPKLKDEHFDIDLNAEAQSGDVPLFIQWDERWGYESYGSGFIGTSGCGPTCLSMAAVYLTKNAEYSPLFVAKMAEENGYCVPGNGSSWTLISEGSTLLGLSAAELPLWEGSMKNALDSGAVVILALGPGDFTGSGHFVVVTGYDDSGFAVNDPNSIDNSLRRWSYERLSGQISNLWSVSIKN